MRALERREVPAEWQASLEALTGPKTDRFTWLNLFWWPGEPWQPIERYSVWEMLPQAWLERTARGKDQFAEIRDALEGPPPHTMRQFHPTSGRFMGSESVVTQEQWDFWRAHHCLARPFWIIQGDTGGHKFTFSPPEQMLLKLNGLPVEPPAPGDLPFAPWDQRVVTALGAQRALQEASFALTPGSDSYTDHSHLVRRKRFEEDFRRSLLAWLKPQVRQGIEESDRQIAAVDLPVGPEITDEQLAGAEASFVSDTSTSVEG